MLVHFLTYEEREMSWMRTVIHYRSLVAMFKKLQELLCKVIKTKHASLA